MAATLMDKIVVRMDGWAGAPGFMTFLGTDMVPLRPKVVAFCTGIRAYFPSTITFTVPSTGDVIRDTDGSLDGTWSTGATAVVNGSAAGAYGAPAGASVTWRTAALAAGASGRSRHLIGKTFLVPLAAAAFDTDGTLLASAVANLQLEANNLVSGGDLYVRHHPTAPGAADGFASVVTSATVPDRVAVLRSRRA